MNITWSVTGKQTAKIKKVYCWCWPKVLRTLGTTLKNSGLRRQKGGFELLGVMQPLYTDTNLCENKGGDPSHVSCAVRAFLHEYSFGSFKFC